MMPMGIEAQKYCLNLANSLRVNGVYVDMFFDNAKMGAQIKRAAKKNAKVAVIVGDNELENGTVVIKNLVTTEQIVVPVEEMIEKVADILEGFEHEHECCCGDDDCCCGEHHHDHDHECKCKDKKGE